jgi:hypothetical protein
LGYKGGGKVKIKTVSAVLKALRKHRDRIAVERDALREVQSDVEDLLADIDDGLAALDDAIDIFSYKQ